MDTSQRTSVPQSNVFFFRGLFGDCTRLTPPPPCQHLHPSNTTRVHTHTHARARLTPTCVYVPLLNHLVRSKRKAPKIRPALRETRTLWKTVLGQSVVYCNNIYSFHVHQFSECTHVPCISVSCEHSQVNQTMDDLKALFLCFTILFQVTEGKNTAKQFLFGSRLHKPIVGETNRAVHTLVGLIFFPSHRSSRHSCL